MGLGAAIGLGMIVMLAGTLPRNALFAANLQVLSGFPWAVPVVAVYLWLFWRYLGGWGPPRETAESRRWLLRAHPLTVGLWARALFAGALGIVALVLALRLAGRLVTLPEQRLPDLAGVPRITVFGLLLAAAPIAGVVEEAAFRGYMQRPIERRYGLAPAILVTGTMFAIAHLDFTPVLWPYYVAVAAIYGSVTYLTDSILPAIVLHTGGNVYSNLDLLLHGQAEWQAGSGPRSLVWRTGIDAPFRRTALALAAVTAATAWAFWRLARARRAAAADPAPRAG